MSDAPEAPRAGRWPDAYFITFSCYGSRLHSDAQGSVDRFHNSPRTPRLEPHPERVAYLKRKMKASPTRLDQRERGVVLREIQRVCSYEGWRLRAAHVRSNHVHVVLSAEIKPEAVMGKLKMFSSRALNDAFGHVQRRWSGHGSTRWLWNAREVEAALHYVLERQGTPMAVYYERQG